MECLDKLELDHLHLAAPFCCRCIQEWDMSSTLSTLQLAGLFAAVKLVTRHPRPNFHITQHQVRTGSAPHLEQRRLFEYQGHDVEPSWRKLWTTAVWGQQLANQSARLTASPPYLTIPTGVPCDVA